MQLVRNLRTDIKNEAYGADMKLYFSAAIYPQIKRERAAFKDSRSDGN